MNKLAVIYARVSTSEQSKGYSLPTQIKGCTEYAQRHNLDVVAVLEEDVSGATRLDERESGARLIEMAERGLINAVIVWRLDRLSRPPEGEYSRLLTTIEQFARYNVSVHECETGEVKSDLTSVMVAFFKGLAASQERAAIRERTMRGIKAKAQAGKWVGQGDPPYGYRKVGTSRDAYLEIHPERAAVVRRIFDLYIGAHGRPKSLKQIAILLTNEGVPTPGQIKKGGHTGRGGWYPSTISRSFISNAMYIGRFEAQGFVTEKPELAIIDDETWTAAQKRREVNVRFAQRNRKRDYLLAGHIRCACGGALVGESKKRRTTGYNVYYRCPKHRYDHIERCPVGYVRADRIEPVVWQWLKELLSDPQKVEDGLLRMAETAKRDASPVHDRLAVVDDLLQKVTNDIGRLVSAFGDTHDVVLATAFQSKVDEKVKLKNSLMEERAGLLAELERVDFTPELRDQIIDIATKVAVLLPKGSYEKKRQLLRVMDVKVEVVEDETGEDYDLRVSCRFAWDTLPIGLHGSGFKSRIPDRWEKPHQQWCGFLLPATWNRTVAHLSYNTSDGIIVLPTVRHDHNCYQQ